MTEAITDLGLPHWVRPLSGKFSRTGAALADRHYSRRKIGAPQFMPPGETVVLISRTGDAVYGWWRPHPRSGLQAMNGLDGWTCTIFRNESRVLSSLLILEAELALTHLVDGCGPDGFITYVDVRKVASRNPGYCYKQAGYVRTGWSADGRKVLLQKPWALAGTTAAAGAALQTEVA